MDLDNSTGLPGLIEGVVRIALLSKDERNAELASKQEAFGEAQKAGTLTDNDTLLMTVSTAILQAIMGADEACPEGSECRDWWLFLADFFHKAAEEAAAQNALMISKSTGEEARINMELMGGDAVDAGGGKEEGIESKLGGMKM